MSGANVIVERVATTPALTRSQLRVVALLADGKTYDEIATLLGVHTSTVRYHIHEAAKRIPGDLSMSTRLVVWYRGAPRHVLERQPAAVVPSNPLRSALAK